jgi:hypothetical protein
MRRFGEDNSCPNTSPMVEAGVDGIRGDPFGKAENWEARVATADHDVVTPVLLHCSRVRRKWSMRALPRGREPIIVPLGS